MEARLLPQTLAWTYPNFFPGAVVIAAFIFVAYVSFEKSVNFDKFVYVDEVSFSIQSQSSRLFFNTKFSNPYSLCNPFLHPLYPL